MDPGGVQSWAQGWKQNLTTASELAALDAVLALVGAPPKDLSLLDVNMPVWDGLTLPERIGLTRGTPGSQPSC